MRHRISTQSFKTQRPILNTSKCQVYCDRCLEKDSCDFQVQPRRQQPVSHAGKLEVPPKLVFSMLNNKDLQAKLRACRLPTDGKRQVHYSSGFTLP